MAKQMENTLAAFSRDSSASIPAAVSGATFLLLVTGLLLAIFNEIWVFTLIFALSIVLLAAFTFVNFRLSRKAKAALANSWIDWQAALPEIQRENLNVEVFELSKILEVETEQISDLQSAYIVAEDLALRQIQQEESVPLMRHVSIAGVPFDAVMSKDDIVVCIEVAFLVSPELRQDKIDSMMRKIASVKGIIEEMNVGMTTRLMMVLITQLTPDDENHLRSQLNVRKFSTTPVDIDIRLLDFEALQRIYVTD